MCGLQSHHPGRVPEPVVDADNNLGRRLLVQTESVLHESPEASHDRGTLKAITDGEHERLAVKRADVLSPNTEQGFARDPQGLAPPQPWASQVSEDLGHGPTGQVPVGQHCGGDRGPRVPLDPPIVPPNEEGRRAIVFLVREGPVLDSSV